MSDSLTINILDNSTINCLLAFPFCGGCVSLTVMRFLHGLYPLTTLTVLLAGITSRSIITPSGDFFTASVKVIHITVNKKNKNAGDVIRTRVLLRE